MSLKQYDKSKAKKEKFQESFVIKKKIYSPLQVLHYNLTFEFDDNYPAKMPKDFARDMITLYSNPGDFVWDGCCGSGIVPRMATQLNRDAFGSDVNPKAIDLCHRHDPKNLHKYSVMNATAAEPESWPEGIKPKLILSSLPFGLNIIGDKNNYSAESGDISNAPNYESFYTGSKAIIQAYFDNLAPNGVCILDARDRLHEGKTIALILEFLKQAQDVGFELVTRFYYELIPYRQMTYKHKPTGHIRAMPETMDVIVLAKLEDQKLGI